MSEARGAMIQAFSTIVNPTTVDAVAQAEAVLKRTSTQRDFTVELLRLVQDGQQDQAVRLAAAVHFKNIVKDSWAYREDNGDVGKHHVPLPEPLRDEIKRFLVTATLTAPTRVAPQLSEALVLIADADFPGQWESLLPDLVLHVASGPLSQRVAALSALAAVFRVFRRTTIEESNDKLDFCQRGAAERICECAESMEEAALTAAGDQTVVRDACAAVRIASDAVFSLNVYGLSKHMDALVQRWMAVWQKWLQWSDASLAASDADEESAEDAMKAQVIVCCHQFLQLHEDDAEPYLAALVPIIWRLLVACGPAPGQDGLAMAALAFLTTLARSTHHGVFRSGDAIRQITEGIVIPSLAMRDDDDERFEGDAVEFLRRDLEAADSDTRRRAASDLLSVLAERFPAETVPAGLAYVEALLATYAAAPGAEARRADCALRLFAALAVRSRTAAAGATAVGPGVDVTAFYRAHVAPELSAASVNDRPLVKAAALRFLYLFRSMLDKVALLEAFPHLVRLLAASATVVHSYAALAVDRILALRTRGSGGPAATAGGASAEAAAAAAGVAGAPPLIATAEVAGQMQPLLGALFGALDKPESGENEYVMRAIARAIAFLGPEIAPVASICLDRLTAKLMDVCQRPVFAVFTHQLFEALAALIGAVAAGAPDALPALEGRLLPSFDAVLQQDAGAELHPYVFQVIALLIVSGRELRAEYVDVMLEPFLRPRFWERRGNVPALTLLLRAYLRAAPAAIVARGLLEPVLGIFQKLLGAPRHLAEAYSLLDAVFARVPLAALQPLLPQLFALLFAALTGPRKSTRNTVLFMASTCRLAVWHGAPVAAGAMDAAQAGSVVPVVGQVFANNVCHVAAPDVRRAVTLGLSSLLADSDALFSNSSAWRAAAGRLADLVDGARALAAAGGGEVRNDSALAESVQEAMEYSNEFAQLSHAQLAPPPLCPEVGDAQIYVGRAFERLLQARGDAARQLLAGLERQQQTVINNCMQLASARTLASAG